MPEVMQSGPGPNWPTKANAPDNERDPQLIARALVASYQNSRTDLSDRNKEDIRPVYTHEVYVVWFSYILGGWKALLSTPVPNLMYYEVIYDKERDRIYLDAYHKTENVQIERIEDHDYGRLHDRWEEVSR